LLLAINNIMALTALEIEELFELPFTELLFQAQAVHRAHFNNAEIQLSTLVSIKTGGCPEDCSYCPQSRRFQTGVEDEPLLSIETVLEKATLAKQAGATRFCMGAAWRGPKEKDIAAVTPLIEAVKALGLEVCGTFGLLKAGQAEQLKDAGLDYYNHNIDTAPDFYGEVIGTRTQEQRHTTLDYVRNAGLNVCCGGIVGMGESRQQRAALIATLANMPTPPQSVPINYLVQVEGTPLHGTDKLDPLEYVRTIACARIAMPRSMVRLSAGRNEMSDAIQALCFMAGANSIFYGEKLLTTDNPGTNADKQLLNRLGLRAMGVEGVLAAQKEFNLC
jgi:biotin synthase